MRPDLRTLLEQAHAELATCLLGALLQADGGGQSRRAATDDHHVILHRFASGGWHSISSGSGLFVHSSLYRELPTRDTVVRSFCPVDLRGAVHDAEREP